MESLTDDRPSPSLHNLIHHYNPVACLGNHGLKVDWRWPNKEKTKENLFVLLETITDGCQTFQSIMFS